jgi:rod shape determining protein RodA
MWNYQSLPRIDLRVIPLILILMGISILILSAHTTPDSSGSFFTPITRVQLRWFAMGWVVFFLCAGFDYNKLREWTWLLYGLLIISLIGLFFTDPIQRVQRWYRIPFVNASFQPSESAKLIVVIALSWFLERRKLQSSQWSTALYAMLILGIPFILVLRQPDLGSALVLFPMALAIFHFGELRPAFTRMLIAVATVGTVSAALVFLGFVSPEDIRPYALKVLKEYQFQRLDPNTHHQKAAAMAIALGGVTGSGWKKSEFTGGGWLPMPYTDAVFPAFGEEFGILGIVVLLSTFYALIYCSFQVVAVSKDHFGRLLAAGLTVYLAVHIIVNIGMMSGFFPITGIPLILVSYGGTSILATMAALGILQSIYSRRFMF